MWIPPNNRLYHVFTPDPQCQHWPGHPCVRPAGGEGRSSQMNSGTTKSGQFSSTDDIEHVEPSKLQEASFPCWASKEVRMSIRFVGWLPGENAAQKDVA